MTARDPWFAALRRCLPPWPWFFVWIGWQWHFNVHRDDCCVLCLTVGPVGFRWHR